MECITFEGGKAMECPGKPKYFNTAELMVSMDKCPRVVCWDGVEGGGGGALRKVQRCLILPLPTHLPKLTHTWTKEKERSKLFLLDMGFGIVWVYCRLIVTSTTYVYIPYIFSFLYSQYCLKPFKT